jgi:hypothetical protein
LYKDIDVYFEGCKNKSCILSQTGDLDKRNVSMIVFRDVRVCDSLGKVQLHYQQNHPHFLLKVFYDEFPNMAFGYDHL